jgi:hypothetical protein
MRRTASPLIAESCGSTRMSAPSRSMPVSTLFLAPPTRKYVLMRVPEITIKHRMVAIFRNAFFDVVEDKPEKLMGLCIYINPQ